MDMVVGDEKCYRYPEHGLSQPVQSSQGFDRLDVGIAPLTLHSAASKDVRVLGSSPRYDVFTTDGGLRPTFRKPLRRPCDVHPIWILACRPLVQTPCEHLAHPRRVRTGRPSNPASFSPKAYGSINVASSHLHYDVLLFPPCFPHRTRRLCRHLCCTRRLWRSQRDHPRPPA